MMSDLKLGTRTVGAAHPTFIIAEIGINHQGDVEIAKELIEEWITNKRFEEAVDEGRTHNRTKVCTTKGTLRSDKDEQTCVGEDCLAPA